MPKAIQKPLRCPSCGQQYVATVQNMVDAVQDPEDKVRLLSGRLNLAVCPNCGTPTAIATPLLFHDSDKEMLIAHVPMELNLRQDEQEKVVGDLLNELTSSLPKGSFKGYMFNPRRALTMQNMVEQILEGDGVTREMMEQQRARVRLVQSFIESGEEELPELVKRHDSEIDAQFFQTFTLMAQRALQEGRPAIAEQVIVIQQQVAQLSTYGQRLLAQQKAQEQTVQSVAADVQALGSGARRQDFLDLALRYAGDDMQLQALVGLVRPVFDYTFFQELTLKIGQAPSDQRDALETLRTRLQELTALVDQQSQMALQQSVSLLQTVVNHPDPDAFIRENIDLIDDTFMAVLTANIQEAEKQRDIALSARLKQVYDRVINVLQENMQPELRFVNELLSSDSDEKAVMMIESRIGEFGPGLLDVLDGVSQVIASQGNQELLSRLAFLKQSVIKILG